LDVPNHTAETTKKKMAAVWSVVADMALSTSAPAGVALRLRREVLHRGEAPARHARLLAAEDDAEQHGDDRRLGEHDHRAADVAHLDGA
jgi:hypothetical protein